MAAEQERRETQGVKTAQPIILTISREGRETVSLPQQIRFLSLSSLSSSNLELNPNRNGTYLRLLDWEITNAQLGIVALTRVSSERIHISSETQAELEQGVVVVEVDDTMPEEVLQRLKGFPKTTGNTILRLAEDMGKPAFEQRVDTRQDRPAYIVPLKDFLALSVIPHDEDLVILQSDRRLALLIEQSLSTLPSTQAYDSMQEVLIAGLKDVIARSLTDHSGHINWGARQGRDSRIPLQTTDYASDEESVPNPTSLPRRTHVDYERVRIVTYNQLSHLHPRQLAGLPKRGYFVLREAAGQSRVSALTYDSLPENTPRQRVAKAAVSLLFTLSHWNPPTLHDINYFRDYKEVYSLITDPLMEEAVMQRVQPWDREVTAPVQPTMHKRHNQIGQKAVLIAFLIATLGTGSAAVVSSVSRGSFDTGNKLTSSEVDHLEGLPSFSQVDWKIEAHGLSGDGYYITDTVAQMTNNQYTLVSSVDHIWQPTQITADTPYQTVSAPILLSGIQSSKLKIPLLAQTTASSISLTTVDGKQIPVKAVVLTDGTIAIEIPGGFALHPTAATLSYNLIQSTEGPHAAIDPKTFAVNLNDFKKVDPQMYQTILGLQQQVLEGQNPDVVVTNYLEQNFTTYSISDPSLQGLSKEQILSSLLRMQTNGFHCSYSNLLKIMLIASITPSSQELPHMTIAQGWKLNTGAVDSSKGNFLTAANGHAFVLTASTPDDYTPATVNPADRQTEQYIHQGNNQSAEQTAWQKEEQQMQQQAQQLSLIIHALEILIPVTTGIATYAEISKRRKKRRYSYRVKRKNKHLHKISKFMGTSARKIASLPENTKREMIRQLETNLFAHFSSEEFHFAANFFNRSSWAASYGSTQLGDLTDNFGFKPVATGTEAVKRIIGGAHFRELRDMLRVNDFNRFYKHFYAQRKMLLVLINRQREKLQLPPIAEVEFHPSRTYAFKYWALAKYAFLYGMQQARQEVKTQRRNTK